MKIKQNRNIFHYDFFISYIFVYVEQFENVLVFECSQSPGEKLTSYLS